MTNLRKNDNPAKKGGSLSSSRGYYGPKQIKKEQINHQGEIAEKKR